MSPNGTSDRISTRFKRILKNGTTDDHSTHWHYANHSHVIQAGIKVAADDDFSAENLERIIGQAGFNSYFNLYTKNISSQLNAYLKDKDIEPRVRYQKGLVRLVNSYLIPTGTTNRNALDEFLLN